MKVQVSNANDMTEEDLERLRQHSKKKIQSWVQRNGNIFPKASDLIDHKVTTIQFLRTHHVCMNCGDVQEKAAYAIAQNAMGHKVNFTCSCGHVTTLPQIP